MALTSERSGACHRASIGLKTTEKQGLVVFISCIELKVKLASVIKWGSEERVEEEGGVSLGELEDKLVCCSNCKWRHPGVCGLHGWTFKNAAGRIWCRYISVGQILRSHKCTSAPSYISRTSDHFVQCKKHYPYYIEAGRTTLQLMKANVLVHSSCLSFVFKFIDILWYSPNLFQIMDAL